ncbi:hypothetical protein [Endothiovibrio diazotrophicus]
MSPELAGLVARLRRCGKAYIAGLWALAARRAGMRECRGRQGAGSDPRKQTTVRRDFRGRYFFRVRKGPVLEGYRTEFEYLKEISYKKWKMGRCSDLRPFLVYGFYRFRTFFPGY